MASEPRERSAPAKRRALILQSPARLRRDVRVLDVVTLGVGAAIGVSIFSVLSAACLSAIRLVDTAPDLHKQAHFRLSRRSVRLWSYLGVLCGISIVLIGLTADWRPYAVLFVWGVAGTIYWRWRSQAGVLVPSADGKVPVR